MPFAHGSARRGAPRRQGEAARERAFRGNRFSANRMPVYELVSVRKIGGTENPKGARLRPGSRGAMRGTEGSRRRLLADACLGISETKSIFPDSGQGKKGMPRSGLVPDCAAVRMPQNANALWASNRNASICAMYGWSVTSQRSERSEIYWHCPRGLNLNPLANSVYSTASL